MHQQQCLIDVEGTIIDLYISYGVVPLQETIPSLIVYPPLRTPPSTKWHEEPYITADLSHPVLDNRTLSLRLYSPTIDTDARLLRDLHGKIFSLRLPLIGLVIQSLRLTGFSTSDSGALTIKGRSPHTLILHLVEDSPLQGYTYIPPQPISAGASVPRLDDRPLSVYGAYLASGSIEAIYPIDLREGISTPHVTSHGYTHYPSKLYTPEARDFTLPLIMTASSPKAIWRNWHALLYDLIRPNARHIKFDTSIDTITCHYKDCHVGSFTYNDQYIIDFDLTFTQLSPNNL